MKKVLIITYYWPPSGGSGVQRWLKFSKYLPENGWKPIIYTPLSNSFNIKDEDLVNEIHSDTEVWKHPIWEPYAFKDKFFGKSDSDNAGIIQDKSSLKNRTMSWIRGNIFIPDPKVFWVSPSVKFLEKKIKEHGITHIISTGPPHSMHLIAMNLKRKNEELKWIADFRDPWSELDLLSEFYLTKRSKKKHKKLEKSVLAYADVTLTVSESWAESFRLLGSKNVKLITNGFDEKDFDLTKKNNDKFVIGHFGLLNHLRNPVNLWRTLNDICRDFPLFEEKLEIRLSGNIDTQVYDSLNQFRHLKNKISFLGYLTHKEVIKEYNNSSVLLLLLFNSSSGVGNYPGKIFEYFASKKPILSFGPKESDAKRLILKTNTGVYHDYNVDNDTLRKDIMNIFENKKEYKFVDDIDCFSRKKLTSDLSDVLNNV